MHIDPSRFRTVNISDTCAIWNVLSSRLLYARARSAGCHFSCTDFVRYECLYKKRKQPCCEDSELQSRLNRAIADGQFQSFPIDLADLQEVSILLNRKRLSLGELSSIAFAKRTEQAFITDDQKARQLAATELSADAVQTTPQLFGWLVFNGILQDGDKDAILVEHVRLKRPLQRFFQEVYLWALQLRLKAGSQGAGV